MQARKHSLIESVTNVVVGYLVAVLSQIVIFPFFDINIPVADNFLTCCGGGSLRGRRRA